MLGTVPTHFNHLTRVLRDRAEQQGRFAAAGVRLGGVAPEVNNPLMAIASHAELRLADANLPAEQRDRPALADRVMFLSGDITQLAGRGLAEVPRDRVLVKPVELAELERRILTFVREKAA